MKKVFFYCLVTLISSSTTIAQTELWPTENARWYFFTYTFGIETYTNFTIDRDTIIQGYNCQIYSKKKKYIDYLSNYQQTTTEDIGKIICLKDSTLLNYNLQKEQFDTIINFKASIGASWRGYLTSECPTTNQDSIFTVSLTNKTVETLNGRDLNVYELTYNSPNLANPYVFNFYQLMGIRSGGEFDEVNNCNFMEAHSTQLNCFIYNIAENDEFEYHYNEEILINGCDYTPSLDVSELYFNKIMVVNPVENKLITILNLDYTSIRNILLYDNLGKTIELTVTQLNHKTVAKIDEHASNGIYNLQIVLDNGEKKNVKILLQ